MLSKQIGKVQQRDVTNKVHIVEDSRLLPREAHRRAILGRFTASYADSTEPSHQISRVLQDLEALPRVLLIAHGNTQLRRPHQTLAIGDFRTTFSLFVFCDNTQALRCYEAAGFQIADYPEDAPLPDF